jgi:hypothetical protein
MGAPVNAVVAATAVVVAAGRHVFLVEGLDAVDALLRVLGPFAVQSARLAEVRFEVENGRIAVRVEAEGLSQDRADCLRRRLQQLPVVTAVSLGWRGTGQTSPLATGNSASSDSESAA